MPVDVPDSEDVEPKQIAVHPFPTFGNVEVTNMHSGRREVAVHLKYVK